MVSWWHDLLQYGSFAIFYYFFTEWMLYDLYETLLDSLSLDSTSAITSIWRDSWILTIGSSTILFSSWLLFDPTLLWLLERAWSTFDNSCTVISSFRAYFSLVSIELWALFAVVVNDILFVKVVFIFFKSRLPLPWKGLLRLLRLIFKIFILLMISYLL